MATLAINLSKAVNRAISAFNVGKLIEAEQICQQVTNAKPDLVDVLRLLAVIQSTLGKKDAALASYKRALKARPDSAELLYNRGLTLHELQRFDEALASYDRALKVRPDYAEAICNRCTRARALDRRNQWIFMDPVIKFILFSALPAS